jgi:hypothetical protein
MTYTIKLDFKKAPETQPNWAKHFFMRYCNIVNDNNHLTTLHLNNKHGSKRIKQYTLDNVVKVIANEMDPNLKIEFSNDYLTNSELVEFTFPDESYFTYYLLKHRPQIYNR